MARTVDTSSTFETWRQNYNNLCTDVGDPVALTTVDKTSVVAGINYIMDQLFFFQDFDYDGSDGDTSNTVFPGSAMNGLDNAGNTFQYKPQKVLVYKNGLLLRSGTDYSAVNGTTITLATSAANADAIRICSYTGSYTDTPSGAESQFYWQTAGSNVYNNNSAGLVLQTGRAIGSIVTAPTVANSIQLDGDTYINADLYLNAQKDLRFRDADSSHYVAIQAPATVSANVTLTLPADDGTSGQFLETNGSGVLTWGTETTYTAGSGLTLSGTAFSVTNEGITSAHILDNTVGADELAVSGDGSNGYALTSDADGTFSWTQFSGSDTTYTTSWVDSSANAILRLTPSSGSADDLTIVAGSGITVTPSGDNLTIAATAGTPTVITVADTTDTTSFVSLFESATGDLGPKTDAGLTYNAGTGVLTATGFAGPITGNVTGNVAGTLTGTVATASQGSVTTMANLVTVGTIGTGVWQGTAINQTYLTGQSGTNTGDQSSVSGNAGTATALATGRTIGMTGDVVWTSPSFTGSGNVTAAATIQTDAVDIAMLSASGTASNSTFLRGDNTWAAPGDANTWRGVTAGGNTLSTSETLAFTAGTNITITETGGAVTINTSATTNTGTTTASNTQTFTNKSGNISQWSNNSNYSTTTGTLTPTGTVNANEFARFTGATTLEARTAAETRSDIGAGTSSLALGSSSSTAYRGDRGTTAYDHSQASHAPSNANNYSHPNHSGHVTSSGDGATTIASGVVTSAMITDGTIVAGDIASNAITTAKINADAVTAAKIGDNVIDSEHYAAGSIDYEHLANDAVQKFKVLDDGTDTTSFPLFVGSATGNLFPKTESNLTFNPVNGTLAPTILSATTITASGDITSNTSDARLKDVLGTIESPLEKLSKINGYEFTWNETAKSLEKNTFDDKIQVGVLAQELEEVLPSVVKSSAFEGYKTVQYEKIVPLLIESIKELQREVESLKDSKS